MSNTAPPDYYLRHQVIAISQHHIMPNKDASKKVQEFTAKYPHYRSLLSPNFVSFHLKLFSFSWNLYMFDLVFVLNMSLKTVFQYNSYFPRKKFIKKSNIT